MANKQSDPIQILANNIVDTMNSVATRRSDKAPFDKSFNATILGVNRKFTDDVSAEDQTALIAKFSLPETVEDGEKNYYIFKINGAYYCSSQNGDFKLYDKIMAYIPNGDWSNLYIDYPDAYSSVSGGSGGSTTSLPDCTVSPDAPGGDEPTDGDLWIVVNDDTLDEFTNITTDTYIKMYRYGTTEDEQIYKWRQAKVAVSKTSAAVDEDNDEYWIKLNDDGKTFEKICQWETSGSTTTFYEIYPNAERGTAPDLTISVKPPMKEGDYWVDIDNETSKNIESFNKYVLNEDTQKCEWEVVFNVPAGGSVGGVGEKVPESPNQTAERFNDYRAYTIAGQSSTGGNFAIGSHDHVEGYGNHGVGGYYNHYQGSYNYGEGGYNNDVGGAYNKEIGCNYTTVRGISSTATACYDAFVYGNNIRVTNLYDSLVVGAGTIQCSNGSHYNLFVGSSGFSATGALYGDIAIGDQHTLTNVGNFAVFGHHCSVSSLNSGLIAGYECSASTNTQSYNLGTIVLGYHGVVNDSNPYQLALGCPQLGSNGFAVDTFGNVYAAGSYGTMGADYAETYEWIDGNPDNEDRRGIIVTLEGKYIRPASSNDDYILGVVSSDPSVCGDTYDLYWHGKYKTDIYGKPLLDDDGKYIISDEYDPEQVYIPQSQRPEKDYVGTNGKLVVIDDGTCIVNKYCKPSTNGIGTYSDDKSDFRVIERLDETHVKVVIK